MIRAGLSPIFALFFVGCLSRCCARFISNPPMEEGRAFMVLGFRVSFGPLAFGQELVSSTTPDCEADPAKVISLETGVKGLVQSHRQLI